MMEILSAFLADHILPLIYEKREVINTCIPHKSTHVGRNFFVEHTLNGSSRMSITNWNIILIKKTSLISLRLWQSLSLRSGFVKIIQFHLKSIERLSFNWLRLLFVTISCPKKRILSCTQDSFYCPPLKASTITWNSSFVRVIPLPILVWSGLQERISNFAGAPLKLTRFSSLVHPCHFQTRWASVLRFQM